MKAKTSRSFRFKGAADTDFLSIQNTGSSGNVCWVVADNGGIDYAGTEIPVDYPFELIPYLDGEQSISTLDNTDVTEVQYYTPNGQRIAEPREGILICRTIYTDGTAKVKKVFYK